MVKKYGVNQFKFDGTGNVDTVVKGSAFDSDFDAAIHLISDLRAGEAGPVHQPYDGHISVAVLADVCGLDMARGRGPQLRRCRTGA